ncbi:hypothetical protein [Crassaminicella profunda]|uniref:hypothetical protein n=1 Tax=Crassaminicella profunda TaxID=1286698 RepID=UPI001CA6C46B|nr:hypothetical protein [Crassaminicella profunda]QZY57173.1 hypothetical protein K7H06_09740 [Crassaminicella profunda]
MDKKEYSFHDDVKETIKDHEERIRDLEIFKHEFKFQLSNIEKNQSDLKATVLEMGSEQSKNFKLILEKFFNITDEAVNAKKKITLIDRKEVWGLIALVVGMILTYLLNLK